METTIEILNTLGVTIDATFIPHDTPAGETPTLRWRLSVRRNGREFHATDYSAGCAHAPEYKKAKALTAAVKAECETGILYGDRLGRPVPPPPVADVVHSLLMDASGTDDRFEDWAANYGFDPDSRTAERMFNACRDTAAALRRTFTADELTALETAFVDY
jgi:hypothetical protein